MNEDSCSIEFTENDHHDLEQLFMFGEVCPFNHKKLPKQISLIQRDSRASL